MAQVFTKTVHVPAWGHCSTVFHVTEGYVPRRILAKTSSRHSGIVFTGARHIVQGQVVIDLWNTGIIPRIVKLGLSDVPPTSPDDDE